MGVRERREREKAELRARIVEAATQLFVDEGIPNVSIRKIADRIEYSPATIYLYFRDKEHLLSCVCGETFAQLKRQLDGTRSDKDPVAGLRRGLRIYIDFALQHPQHYLLTFCTPHTHYAVAAGSPEYEQANTAGLEAFDVLRQALTLCRDAGAAQFEDLEATAQAVWSFIHGTASLLITCYDDPGFPWVAKEKLIESSLDLVMKALGAGAKKTKGGRR
ncbi:MAG: TetR/AcrR family transcriptional regulator [Bryobacteraceae bacterium]|nr:TetR/AcrR family transcriptional regulator [Bryobacteraceae bacterium]